jgi:hypothetical protein
MVLIAISPPSSYVISPDSCGLGLKPLVMQLEAIKQTKVDMQVFLGNYVLPDDNDAAYNRQRTAIKSAIETYGVDHIEGMLTVFRPPFWN